ncbi:MAG TPA: hypothetical protein VGK06_03390 [Methanosarcina sp.]
MRTLFPNPIGVITSLFKKGLSEKQLLNLKRHEGVINRRNG